MNLGEVRGDFPLVVSKRGRIVLLSYDIQVPIVGDRLVKFAYETLLNIINNPVQLFVESEEGEEDRFRRRFRRRFRHCHPQARATGMCSYSSSLTVLTAIRTVKIIQDNHLRDLLPVLGIILGDEPGCPEAELPLDVEPGPIVDGGPKLGGFDADATYPEVETLLEIDVEPPTDDGGVSPELSFSDAVGVERRGAAPRTVSRALWVCSWKSHR